MKLDPKYRGNKGRFPETPPESTIDESFADEILRKAEGRTMFLDFVYMVFMGFWNIIKGFFIIEGKTKDNDNQESVT
jgi:hypothetical protein